MKRRYSVSLMLATAVLLLVAFFDWNWLGEPLNHLVSRKAHREFRSSDLQVRLGLTPSVRLADVFLANPSWADGPVMARFGVLEFSISLRDLFDGKILIPRVAITDGDVAFERLADGRKNWTLADPSDTSPSRLRISSLSVTRGRLRYNDRGLPVALDLAVSTLAPGGATVDSSRGYTTRYVFSGIYRTAKFEGDALTGDILSFQESGIPFPIRGRLAAGTTHLELEGRIADAADISAIDVRLKIAGQTLANIYPFLQLPLPASPPYRLEGHLTQVGGRYGLDQIEGQIGSSDVDGSGAWVRRTPRPLLEARLHSALVRVADLGPLIGVQTATSGGKPAPSQGQTQDRPTAAAHEKASAGDRVLPAGTFEGSRLQAIDADIDVRADRVQAPDGLGIVGVHVAARLADAVLALDPVTLGLADGQVTGRITLDARQPSIRGSITAEATRLRFQDMLPRSTRIVRSQSLIGARLRLEGSGNSIADMAAHAEGHVSAVMSGGRVSNLLDAAIGLNGGKVATLLVGGDKDIALRCGAISFDVKNGQGRSKLFVVDTEQTRIDGNGQFDLGRERFDATITPRPKQPGLFSLRTPFRVYGSFRHPDFALDKTSLALRGGGAVALAVLAPIAALVPLVETGSGSDADCARVSTVDASATAAASKPATPSTTPNPSQTGRPTTR